MYFANASFSLGKLTSTTLLFHILWNNINLNTSMKNTEAQRNETGLQKNFVKVYAHALFVFVFQRTLKKEVQRGCI